MSERIQDVSPPAEVEAQVPDLPQPGGDRPKSQAEALRRAVAEAVAGPPVDRGAASGQVNALLAAFVPMEANGRLLLELLASNAFEGLVDAQGIACRREAVRALLRIGFPWALEIEPETLTWFRSAESSGRRTRWVLAGALLVALLGGTGLWVVTRDLLPPETPVARPRPAPAPAPAPAPTPPPPPPVLYYQTSTSPPPPQTRPVTPSKEPGY
jgi:hypothetical protein